MPPMSRDEGSVQVSSAGTPLSWVDRRNEWVALYNYAYENYVELEAKGRMKAVTICLQRHWRDMVRMKEVVNG